MHAAEKLRELHKHKMANAQDFPADDTPISFEIRGLEELNNAENDPLNEYEYTEDELNEMYDRYVQNNLPQAEVPTVSEEPQPPVKGKKKKSRFVQVTDQKADNIATKAVKDKTHTQTKWAVRVFTGICLEKVTFVRFCRRTLLILSQRKTQKQNSSKYSFI